MINKNDNDIKLSSCERLINPYDLPEDYIGPVELSNVSIKLNWDTLENNIYNKQYCWITSPYICPNCSIEMDRIPQTDSYTTGTSEAESYQCRKCKMMIFTTKTINYPLYNFKLYTDI